ncbi:sushi domain-containing protein 6 isoform X1 [Chanodichthys erythropterus]|uniref:sushi domain-containing protein 6 isoform X1 n=1 Tax=Chanodichthys erythropterus TaxID=933992 RepID=UPI00351DAF59
MCNGMVACETRASLAHRVATTSLLLLLLGMLPTGQASGCPRPSVVPHGRGNLTETNRGSFPVGTLLQYSCDPGYTLDGYSIITCTVSGHWSSDPPRCIKNDVCQPPSEPENGGYNCHPSPCHRLTQGTVIEYFCDEGYVLKGGYQFRTCDNGEWKSSMQISCHSVQGEEQHSTLPMPALSIVASTASSVALILLLVVLFVLLQPKLKSFHHSRSREQGVSGQPTSIMVEGVQVSLPSYEEAVYGAGGTSVPPPESRVQIVLSEGPQAEGLNEPLEQAQTSYSFPSTSTAAPLCHAETVLVHQVPSSSSPSSSSSHSWAAEQPGAAAPLHRRQSSESSDQHSLLSVTSAEDYGDDIPLLKEA